MKKFHISVHVFYSDDVHFKTNPKIPGIDLNSVRLLFDMLMKPDFARLLEQVGQENENIADMLKMAPFFFFSFFVWENLASNCKLLYCNHWRHSELLLGGERK